MAILTLAQTFEHITVISVKENTNIKKAQGTGSYVGTQLNYENSEGNLNSAKWQQDWLDNQHQEELKASVQALKNGDKVTLYKEKTIDEDKYNGMDAASKKKAGFWSVRKIYQGHIEPPECAGSKKSTAAGKKTTGKPQGRSNVVASDKDIGMKVGHAIKGATSLCLRVKKDFVEGAKEVYEVTDRLTAEYIEKTGADPYQAGQTVGNAVLNACLLASPNRPMEATARKLLDDYIPVITQYITEKEKPAPAPEPAAEAQDEQVPEQQGGFDDDIPF